MRGRPASTHTRRCASTVASAKSCRSSPLRSALDPLDDDTERRYVPLHMELLRQFIDIFLHVDDHLLRLVTDYGAWVYAILFVVIFCETGLVVTPFLPGDSLLFAAGALAAGTAGATGD